MTTDMARAGLEPGCKVKIGIPAIPSGSFSEAETRTIERMASSGPWRYVRSDEPFSAKVVVAHLGVVEVAVWADCVQRDYDDAQAARLTRLDKLRNAYHPDPSKIVGPIERYICVQVKDDTTGDRHAFLWGDTFEEAIESAGGEILDGWGIEAVFDLDTGARIDVHVSSPIVTRSEDQGIMVNVLDEPPPKPTIIRFIATVSDEAREGVEETLALLSLRPGVEVKACASYPPSGPPEPVVITGLGPVDPVAVANAITFQAKQA